MSLYAYPLTLPGPAPGNVSVAERHLGSEVAGFQQVRRIQYDYLATQEVTFLFTDEQAKVFYQWWRDKLRRGGIWFVASWPLPKNWSTATRRFIDPPTWNYTAGGAWTVSAKTQVRGACLFPEEPQTNFSGVLGLDKAVIGIDGAPIGVSGITNR